MSYLLCRWTDGSRTKAGAGSGHGPHADQLRSSEALSTRRCSSDQLPCPTSSVLSLLAKRVLNTTSGPLLRSKRCLQQQQGRRGGGVLPHAHSWRVPGPDPHAQERGKSLPIKQHRAYGLGGVHKNACGCVSARVVSKYLHVPLNKYGLKSGLGREKRVPGTFGAFQSRAGGSRPPGAPLHALVWLPREPESAADRGQHSGIRILTLPPTTRA